MREDKAPFVCPAVFAKPRLFIAKTWLLIKFLFQMCASFLCLLFLLFSSFELAAEESAEQLLDFHSKPEVFVPLNLEAMSCHILTVLSKAAVMSENFIIPV